ncbi:GxxExxY protein [Oryzomonas sagensis]|uniref:GxxExxY protein n=1 Tax=Oryzomonas sagensis TaxID=2603857 RepID=A0ABQ6TQ53_9BACT|nr:GxxExxY protein [Oryzomonas sagensis]KAB0671163.1 GxxExxY protein [Oryzomonas sagensis]
MTREEIDSLSNKVIGALIEVHRCLGPGLLESAYEECLCRELELRGIAFERQASLSIAYKGIQIDAAYRIDILVENALILELKSVAKLESIHEAQVLTYLKLKNLWLGLLINFNVSVLKDGIRRMVNG